MSKNKLPENVKRLRGTYRGHRERKSEPLERSVPKRPAGMSEGGKKCWKMLIARLEKIGTLTQVDDLSVMIMSEGLATFMRTSKFIEENGDTFKFTNSKGEVSMKIRPEIRVLNDSWTRVFAMFKQYGLTHASRNNISPLPDSEEKNPWSDL